MESGVSLYDVITVVILGAAVLYYFIIPGASDVIDIKNKAKKGKQTEEESEGPK